MATRKLLTHVLDANRSNGSLPLMVYVSACRMVGVSGVVPSLYNLDRDRHGKTGDLPDRTLFSKQVTSKVIAQGPRGQTKERSQAAGLASALWEDEAQTSFELS